MDGGAKMGRRTQRRVIVRRPSSVLKVLKESQDGGYSPQTLLGDEGVARERPGMKVSRVTIKS